MESSYTVNVAFLISAKKTDYEYLKHQDNCLSSYRKVVRCLSSAQISHCGQRESLSWDTCKVTVYWHQSVLCKCLLLKWEERGKINYPRLDSATCCARTGLIEEGLGELRTVLRKNTYLLKGTGQSTHEKQPYNIKKCWFRLF